MKRFSITFSYVKCLNVKRENNNNKREKEKEKTTSVMEVEQATTGEESKTTTTTTTAVTPPPPKSAGSITLQTIGGYSVVTENNESVPDTYKDFETFVMEKTKIALPADSPESLVIVSKGVVMGPDTYKKPNLSENELYILILAPKSAITSEAAYASKDFSSYLDTLSNNESNGNNKKEEEEEEEEEGEEEEEEEEVYDLNDLEVVEEKIPFKGTVAGKYLTKLAKLLVPAPAEYPPLPQIPDKLVAALTGMGLSETRARNALLRNGMNPDAAANYCFEHWDDPREEVIITPKEYAEMRGRSSMGGPRLCPPEYVVEHFADKMGSMDIPLECLPLNVKTQMTERGLSAVDNVCSAILSQSFLDTLKIESAQSAVRGFLEDPLNFVPNDEQIEILSPFIEKAAKRVHLS